MNVRPQVPLIASFPKNKSKRFRQSRYRRQRAGVCAAAARAITAAGLYLDGHVLTLDDAALSCGSCVNYIQAAIVLIKSENAAVFERVWCGQMSLQAAAAQLWQVASLVDAYRKAGAADRVAFAKTIGPTTLFDTALVPAI
jgi:hypothetical protein